MYEPPTHHTSTPAYIPGRGDTPPAAPTDPPASSPPRRRAWPALLLVAVVSASLGSGATYLATRGDGVQQPEIVEAAEPVPVEDEAPPSPTPPVEPTMSTKLGQPVKLGFITATVYRYKRLAEEGFQGAKLGAVELKVCNTSDQAFEVSGMPWALNFADDTVSDASAQHTGYAQPEYPVLGRKLNPTKCTRGWITFTLSNGQKPTTVEYAPDGLKEDEEAPTVTWRLG